MPGYCEGDLAPIAAADGRRSSAARATCASWPSSSARPVAGCDDYGAYDIEILAEINHAPRLPLAEILRQAASSAADGADVIDLGCDPGEPGPASASACGRCATTGHRVSIDSYNPARDRAGRAGRGGAGAERQRDATASGAATGAARSSSCPTMPPTLGGLDETVELLAARGVPLRIDPVLEPIGFGFAASLGRYLEVRRRYPDAEMMMGVGNLTELTDVDSAGDQRAAAGLLPGAGHPQRADDAGHQLVPHAACASATWPAGWSITPCTQRTLPKHLEPRLVMLRDPKLLRHGAESSGRLAGRDHRPQLPPVRRGRASCT